MCLICAISVLAIDEVLSLSSLAIKNLPLAWEIWLESSIIPSERSAKSHRFHIARFYATPDVRRSTSWHPECVQLLRATQRGSNQFDEKWSGIC